MKLNFYGFQVIVIYLKKEMVDELAIKSSSKVYDDDDDDSNGCLFQPEHDRAKENAKHSHPVHILE